MDSTPPTVQAVAADASSQPVVTIRALTPRTVEVAPLAAENNNNNNAGYLTKLAASVLPGARREADRCDHCGREDTAFARVTTYASQLDRCRVCGARVCGKCSVRPKNLQVPPELLHPDFSRPPTASATRVVQPPVAEGGAGEGAAVVAPVVVASQPVAPNATAAASSSVCLCAPSLGPCEARVRAALMESLRARHARDCDLPLAEYFMGGERQLFLHPKPADADADTPERRQQRRLLVAEIVLDKVADFGGYGLVAKGLKYAYYGHELVGPHSFFLVAASPHACTTHASLNKVSLLVNADLLTALAPVMDGLREFNIKGPNGLLAVYYLACHHDLQVGGPSPI